MFQGLGFRAWMLLGSDLRVQGLGTKVAAGLLQGTSNFALMF